MKKFDFSIVVCCYRGEETIIRCLNSLICQNYYLSTYEIIIVDDGSIDNSSSIILDYLNNLKNNIPSIKYYRTDNNGLSKARNFGINFSQGDYILFIDEDAEASKEWLSEYKKTIDSRNSPDVIYGNVLPFNNAGKFEKFISQNFYTKVNKNGNIIPVLVGTNMGYKKKIFNNAGFFDYFIYRGDETIFLSSLNFQYTSYSNVNAYVFHKNPENLYQWLVERMQNGESNLLVNYFKIRILKIDTITNLYLRILKRIIIITFFIGSFAYSLSILPVVVVSSIYLYYLYKEELIGRKIYLNNKNYNNQTLIIIVSICIRFLGNIAKEYGFILKLLKTKPNFTNKKSFTEHIQKFLLK